MITSFLFLWIYIPVISVTVQVFQFLLYIFWGLLFIVYKLNQFPFELFIFMKLLSLPLNFKAENFKKYINVVILIWLCPWYLLKSFYFQLFGILRCVSFKQHITGLKNQVWVFAINWGILCAQCYSYIWIFYCILYFHLFFSVFVPFPCLHLDYFSFVFHP